MTAPARAPYSRHASTVSTTTADAKQGYKDARAALAECSTESLQSEYMDMMRHSFGVFGHNAATMAACTVCGSQLGRRNTSGRCRAHPPIDSERMAAVSHARPSYFTAERRLEAIRAAMTTPVHFQGVAGERNAFQTILGRVQQALDGIDWRKAQ